MSLIPKNPAQRLYLLRLAAAMTAYLLLLLIAKHTLERHHFGQLLTGLIAVLPALPILAVIAGVGLYITEEEDEFERTITMQCMLCGIAATLAVDSVWGFLEIFAAAPHIAPYLNFCVFWFFAGIANPIVRGEIPVNNRLRILRAERGWSQADLADRLGVSRQSVNAIETGKYDPSLPLAFKVARLFGATIEAIFSDDAGP